MRLIKDTFPEEPSRALAVANCESGLNPNAYNSKNVNGTTDSGIFQINSTHNSRLNEMGLDVFDPEDNVKFARILYEEHRWQPWVCYRKLSML